MSNCEERGTFLHFIFSLFSLRSCEAAGGVWYFNELMVRISGHTVLTSRLYYHSFITGAELERTEQEVENLRKEVDKLKHCGEKHISVTICVKYDGIRGCVPLHKNLFKTA